MKKIGENNVFLVILIAFIALASVIAIFSENIEHFIFPGKNDISKQELTEKVILVINNEKSYYEEIEVILNDGMTAFSLLKEETERINLNFEFKTYDIGVFIEKIGDMENGEDGKYWLYYVNGEMPQVAADKQLLNSGDKVEFKFELSTF